MEKCGADTKNIEKYPFVDTNVFIGQWPFRKLSYNRPQELLAVMSKKGIDKMWVSTFEGIFWNNSQDANELLYKETRDIPQFITFATMNPTFPGWEEDIKKCKLKYNMKGIRVYPNYHNYSLDSMEFKSLLKKADTLSLPVCIYCRLFDERIHPHFARVEPVDLNGLKNIIANFSHLPLIICNCNLADLSRIEQILKEYQNIYIEISHLESVGVVRKLIDNIGIERILFGTYAPYFYIESSFLKIKESRFSEDETEMLFSQNAERLIL